MNSKTISILGSTGSIGRQTLEVMSHWPDQLEVAALSCGRNIDLLEQQIYTFRPLLASVALESDAIALQKKLRGKHLNTEVYWGQEGNIACASLPEAEMVVAAMVGMEGLIPVISAIEAGKDIALANKETLVVAGQIVLPLLENYKVKLFPVDSEHSAIWQCLWGQPNGSLEHVFLTASGGPFRNYTQQQLEEVTVEQALHHPTWKMGGKITIDSATMMNKGLEVIEAKWLFGLDLDQISILVHPQSVVHSMVRMKDGSVLAQLGRPDMKLPIQVALSYPFRSENISPPFDPLKENFTHWQFEPCNQELFPCVKLAYEACKIGGTMTAALNCANEEAVALFLQDKISFVQIPSLIEQVMDMHLKSTFQADFDLEAVLQIDLWARKTLKQLI